MKSKLALIAFALSAPAAFAHPHHPAPSMPVEFDRMQKLVGTWEGTGDFGESKQAPITVVYELTSGGSAMVEKLNPGTPQEMTSIYYKEGKTLAMTHYCAMNNHPQMKLKKSDDNSFAFEMTGTAGISSIKEPHMHALTLTLADANTLKQEWTNYEDGKKKGTVTFELKRKK